MDHPIHRELTENEREKFKTFFFQRLKKDKLYKVIHRYPSFFIYLFLTYIFINFSIILFLVYLEPVLALVAISAFLAAQLHFILSHTLMHTLFTDYPQWFGQSGKVRKIQTLMVTFYGFYHHHHKFSDNWFEELSFFNPTKTSHNIAYVGLSHWYSYSFIRTSFWIYLLPIIALFFFVSPLSALVAYAGFEVGQMFIPIGHAYGHNITMNESKGENEDNHSFLKEGTNSLFSFTFLFLNKIKILASPRQHAPHHSDYTKNKFVYQSFSSSGIYFPFLDALFDRYYNWSFGDSSQKAYDKMFPSAMALMAANFMFPLFLGYLIT